MSNCIPTYDPVTHIDMLHWNSDFPSVPRQVSYLPDHVEASKLYYRTVPSNTYIADALISLCEMFQWYKLAVFTSDEESYLEVEILFGIFKYLQNH